MLRRRGDTRKVTDFTIPVFSAIISGLTTWYSRRIFAIQLWPTLPQSLQRQPRRAEDWVALRASNEDRTSAQEVQSDYSRAYSRNSKRHPHW
jgi:hypothetical protein